MHRIVKRTFLPASYGRDSEPIETVTEFEDTMEAMDYMGPIKWPIVRKTWEMVKEAQVFKTVSTFENVCNGDVFKMEIEYSIR